MTKQEAIKTLDQAISQINTTRQNHALLWEALQYLTTLKENQEK